MRGYLVFSRVALLALAVAALVGHMKGFGFSTGR